jgi:hypothetical protein
MGFSKGLAGILYMLVKSIQLVKQLGEDEELKKLVKNGLGKIVATLKEFGYLPEVDSIAEETHPSLENGTPGVIPLFTQAALLFPEMAS